MNFFAFNEAAINGQPSYDISLEGSADIAFDVEHDGIVWKLLAGEMGVEMTTTAALSTGVLIDGSNAIEFVTTGQAYQRNMAQGTIGITLDTLGAMASGTLLEGTAPILLTVSLDAEIRQTIHRLEGVIGMRIDGLLDGRRTQAHRPGMPLSIDMGVSGSAWLEMHGDGGTAAMEVSLAGVSRIGSKIPLEGTASMAITARMDARRYAQVQIEGSSEMRLDLIANKAGRPPIPTEYVPAPPSRRFTVSRSVWERRITDDRRL